MLYYVGAVFALGLNLSANDPILAGTGDPRYPGGFIVMIERAGIRGLPHVVNAVMLIAALSVANADLYITVKLLHSCALTKFRVGRCMRLRTKVMRHNGY